MRSDQASLPSNARCFRFLMKGLQLFRIGEAALLFRDPGCRHADLRRTRGRR